MLKGQKKTDYQREYMGKLRLGSRLLDPSVRPIKITGVLNNTFTNNTYGAVELDADGNSIPEY